MKQFLKRKSSPKFNDDIIQKTISIVLYVYVCANYDIRYVYTMGTSCYKNLLDNFVFFRRLTISARLLESQTTSHITDRRFNSFFLN